MADMVNNFKSCLVADVTVLGGVLNSCHEFRRKYYIQTRNFFVISTRAWVLFFNPLSSVRNTTFQITLMTVPVFFPDSFVCNCRRR